MLFARTEYGEEECRKSMGTASDNDTHSLPRGLSRSLHTTIVFYSADFPFPHRKVTHILPLQYNESYLEQNYSLTDILERAEGVGTGSEEGRVMGSVARRDIGVQGQGG